jgi:hypothetical protein
VADHRAAWKPSADRELREESLMAVQLTASGPEPVLHIALIAAHAVSGVIAFVLGAVLILRRGRQPALVLAYVLALTLMALCVTGAVALGWPALTPAIQSLFAALLALAAYAVWRGWQAQRKLTAPGPPPSSALDDVGFTLTTLFTGFVVILTGDLDGPVWLLAAAGFLAVVAGRWAVDLIKRRRQPPGSRPGQVSGDSTGLRRRERDESADQHR